MCLTWRVVSGRIIDRTEVGSSRICFLKVNQVRTTEVQTLGYKLVSNIQVSDLCCIRNDGSSSSDLTFNVEVKLRVGVVNTNTNISSRTFIDEDSIIFVGTSANGKFHGLRSIDAERSYLSIRYSSGSFNEVLTCTSNSKGIIINYSDEMFASSDRTLETIFTKLEVKSLIVIQSMRDRRDRNNTIRPTIGSAGPRTSRYATSSFKTLL